MRPFIAAAWLDIGRCIAFCFLCVESASEIASDLNVLKLRQQGNICCHVSATGTILWSTVCCTCDKVTFVLCFGVESDIDCRFERVSLQDSEFDTCVSLLCITCAGFDDLLCFDVHFEIAFILLLHGCYPKWKRTLCVCHLCRSCGAYWLFDNVSEIAVKIRFDVDVFRQPPLRGMSVFQDTEHISSLWGISYLYRYQCGFGIGSSGVWFG